MSNLEDSVSQNTGSNWSPGSNPQSMLGIDFRCWRPLEVRVMFKWSSRSYEIHKHRSAALLLELWQLSIVQADMHELITFGQMFDQNFCNATLPLSRCVDLQVKIWMLLWFLCEVPMCYLQSWQVYCHVANIYKVALQRISFRVSLYMFREMIMSI